MRQNVCWHSTAHLNPSPEYAEMTKDFSVTSGDPQSSP